MVKQVATWDGVPVDELSRDELHEAFCELLEALEQERERSMKLSVEHVHALAEMARRNYTRR